MLNDEMHKVNGGIVAKTGVCRFCGQIKSVEVPEEWDDEKLDELVAESCNCDVAMRYQKKKKRREGAEEKLKEILEYEAEDDEDGMVPDDAKELSYVALEKILEGPINQITVETENGIKIKMKKNTKGYVRMERKKTKTKSCEV